eukprot:TRINITY_DN25690_c0_g1_i1.p2 TRINITY_DN25690_c0_g1~~TRINITY_DN25690_c0_g1_i1.p2  ORF type:complete len:114 (-),score=0.30 TRINITY_DN25690_c0_g1_i1:154-495(-)
MHAMYSLICMSKANMNKQQASYMHKSRAFCKKQRSTDKKPGDHLCSHPGELGVQGWEQDVPSEGYGNGWRAKSTCLDEEGVTIGLLGIERVPHKDLGCTCKEHSADKVPYTWL